MRDQNSAHVQGSPVRHQINPEHVVEERIPCALEDTRIPPEFRVLDELGFCGVANESQKNSRSTRFVIERHSIVETVCTHSESQDARVFTARRDLECYPPGIPRRQGVAKLSVGKPRNDSPLQFSQGLTGMRNVFKNCNDWTEYKARVNCFSKDDKFDLISSPVGHLWQGDDVTPLVQPCEATTPGTVRARIVLSVHSCVLQ